MEITKIPLSKQNDISAVYMITFDDHWFYIGSTLSLHRRQIVWSTSFSTGNNLKSRNIKTILHSKSVIKFHIIHQCKDLYRLREIEANHIKTHWNDEKLLNRSPSSFNAAGRKPRLGYKPKEKKIPIDSRKKVAVFDLDGNLIQIFESRSEFGRVYKTKLDLVTKILSGKRGQYRKFHIKGVSHDGSFIEPKKFTPKNPFRDQSKNMKAVKQIDANGKVVAIHINFREAAKKIGCSRELIHRVIKGKTPRSKTAKGFTFEYA